MARHAVTPTESWMPSNNPFTTTLAARGKLSRARAPATIVILLHGFYTMHASSVKRLVPHILDRGFWTPFLQIFCVNKPLILLMQIFYKLHATNLLNRLPIVSFSRILRAIAGRRPHVDADAGWHCVGRRR